MSLRALYDVLAPAKLNLFLHVTGRRADGYHLLQSLFVLIDWADRLHFERREDGRLARRDLGAALPADDLSVRAARALQSASGTALGADIQIDKQVPWGAGLGGGSSDAASTLLALNRMWGLNWPRSRLATIGLALGADVPFFIGGRAALVEGIGETLTPVTLPGHCYAVVKPAASIETRSIFGHPGLRRDTAAVILCGSSEDRARTVQDTMRHWAEAGLGSNDLQGPATDLCPDVARAAAWLQARYGNSRMTGSGSAVFAKLDCSTDMAAPPEAMPTQTGPIADLPVGWVGRTCRAIAEHPLAAWAE